jgi:hypothetical protein
MSRLHSFSLSHTSSSVTPDGLLQMLGNRAGIPPCILCICGRDHGHSVGTAGNAAIVHTTCPSLTSLTLSMCGMAVTDRVLTAVAAASPRLAQLACVQATNVSDYGVRAVASLPRLALLDLSLCQRITGVCFGVGRQGGRVHAGGQSATLSQQAVRGSALGILQFETDSVWGSLLFAAWIGCREAQRQGGGSEEIIDVSY